MIKKESKSKSNKFTIGIDASNLRGGGGLTHLVELLRIANPLKHDFSRIIVWGEKETLSILEDKPWLIKHEISDFYNGFMQRTIFQCFYLTKAAQNAEHLDLEINYSVDNCESTKFKSESFDLVFGSGILHHLNLNIALKEINRILKKDGEMVFLEPLGTNPLINLYRKFTPNSRSVDEHPFLKKDFDFIHSLFNQVTVKYYGFFTLIFFLLYGNPKKSLMFKIISKLDNYFFRIKYFKSLAWSVMIVAKKN